MADRISQQNLKSVFEIWLKTFGLKASKGYKDPGLFIEMGPLGGYRVAERFGDSGAVNDMVITSGLKSARELYDCLVFAFRTVDYKKHRRTNPRPR